MATHDIPMAKAELLALALEAILYGFSLLMFSATIWTLLFQRLGRQVNHKMLIVTCALLALSTAHIIIVTIRLMEGLIFYADTFPGGPDQFFLAVNQWSAVWMNCVYITQSLLGDGVLLYRCYSVWQSKLVMVLPLLLWCATGATGFTSSYIASEGKESDIFDGTLSRMITAFWATALATNLLTTGLLAGRIWYLDQRVKSLRAHPNSQLRAILHVILDSAVIYSVSLLAALVCFIIKTNGQFVVLNMVTPIMAITFYLVIIRVGLADRANALGVFPPGYASSGNSYGADPRSRMEVHVPMLPDSKMENGTRSPMPSMDRENRWKGTQLEDSNWR